MIIIEGADLVGKTTLAHKLVKKLNEMGWPHTYHHLGVPPPAWAEDPVTAHRLLASPYSVWDRFHMSEPVYAAEARKQVSLLDPRRYRQLDFDLSCHGMYMILVVADPELLRERYERLKEREMFRLDRVLAVNEAFGEIVASPASWRGYRMRLDLAYRTDADKPFALPPSLIAYTDRLRVTHPWPGALTAREAEARRKEKEAAR